MTYVSPGVYTKIFDLSEYVRNVPSTIGFIALVSEKGPDNQFVFTNARDFFIDFGEPDIMYGAKEGVSQGKYVASSFLTQSDSLYVIRVCDETAASYANIALGGVDAELDSLDGTATIVAENIESLNTEKEVLSALSDGTAENAVIFTGLGRGDWYNNYRIQISKPRNTIRASEGIYVLSIWKKQMGQDYDVDTETWYDTFEIDQSFEISFDPDKLDYTGESMFVEDVVNRYFRDIEVYADKDKCRLLNELNVNWAEPFPESGDYRWDVSLSLAEGSDGNTLAQADSLLAKAYSGTLKRSKNVQPEGVYFSDEVVDEVLDTEDYYFSIVLDGGYSVNVKEEIKSLAASYRQDCVALMDMGDNKSANEALDKRRTVYTYNTPYAALYESYSKIYDRYSGRDIWVTPVYHMANIVPYTDNVTELWYAPAGFNRATISAIKALRYSPRQGQRDLFYLEQINPIVKFNPGYTVWGQLTSQKRATAMQDLNIVRLVQYINKALKTFVQFYLFEMNNEDTWNAIRTNIDAFLKTIKDKRGLYSYGVEVGATEYEIKAKQVHTNITLQPTRVVEQIHLNFYIK
jgi:hypothetical protein